MVRRVPIARNSLVAYSTWICRLFKNGIGVGIQIGRNVVTTEGLNYLANVALHGSTQISPWYVALIGSNTTPSATCTYAVPVFTEFTAYSEATRREYVEAEASAGVTTNTASPARFTFNSDSTVYGGCLVGGGTAASTKSDTAGGGTLLCAHKFDITWEVDTTDYMDVIVQFTFTSA